MFTHRVNIELNPDSFTEFSRKIQTEIMPALRLQKGFCDGLTTIAPERASAIEDTRWETKEDAEEYQRTGYPEILKILSSVAKTTPTTSIFELHQ
jgi:hypothetical protein